MYPGDCGAQVVAAPAENAALTRFNPTGSAAVLEWLRFDTGGFRELRGLKCRSGVRCEERSDVSRSSNARRGCKPRGPRWVGPSCTRNRHCGVDLSSGWFPNVGCEVSVKRTCTDEHAQRAIESPVLTRNRERTSATGRVTRAGPRKRIARHYPRRVSRAPPPIGRERKIYSSHFDAFALEAIWHVFVVGRGGRRWPSAHGAFSLRLDGRVIKARREEARSFAGNNLFVSALRPVGRPMW